MVEIARRDDSTECKSGSPESRNRSRQLGVLREQLTRENRRSAGPFSHPLASQGPLFRLREQIRDVSRIADAVAASADSATDARLNELCSDIRRLIQTQQGWTSRLENQIWRLESQGKLMRRLLQFSAPGSSGTDQLRDLCELIARETQSVPDGLLLLPEPGHRIALPADGVNHLAAMAIEQARFSVFVAMSLLPDGRGADLVAGTFHASASTVTQSAPLNSADAALQIMRSFAEQVMRSTPLRELSGSSSRIVSLTCELLARIERLSFTAADCIVPPGIKEFYGTIAEDWPSSLDGDEQQMARSICIALGLTDATSAERTGIEAGDERLVLTHKLRWHGGENSFEETSAPRTGRKRLRPPHFLKASKEAPRFAVFTE